MKRLIGFSVMLAVLLSVMPAAPAVAQQYVPPPPNWYQSLFYNLGSELCLQPWDEAPTSGD